MCDGSEARKTREEKELVYVKVVIDGRPTCLFLASQRMRDFGGKSADALNDAIVSALVTMVWIYGEVTFLS